MNSILWLLEWIRGYTLETWDMKLRCGGVPARIVPLRVMTTKNRKWVWKL